MNFLQLVQKVWTKCGLTGAGPSTVTGQSGMSSRVVQYVAEAYRDIQQRHDTWNWMWTRVESATLTIGDNTYLPGDLGVTNPTARGVQRVLLQVDGKWQPIFYDRKRRDPTVYDNVTTSAKPGRVTILPNGQWKFDALPDAAYPVAVEYFRTSHELVDSTDVPLLPEEFHWAIYWKAIEYYGHYDEDGSLLTEAQKNFASTMSRLERVALPPLTFDDTVSY